MKLYYSPVTCSLAPYIALQESGLPFELVIVDLKTHTLPDGSDYYAINPFGFVPMLALDDGRLLSEGVAILQYIADQAAEKALAPANGSFERYELQGRLNVVATDLIRNYDLLFSSLANAEVKSAAVRALHKHYGWIDGILQQRGWFYGDGFTVADAYLYTVTGWAPRVGLDLSAFAAVQSWQQRIASRPAVQPALAVEYGDAASCAG